MRAIHQDILLTLAGRSDPEVDGGAARQRYLRRFAELYPGSPRMPYAVQLFPEVRSYLEDD